MTCNPMPCGCAVECEYEPLGILFSVEDIGDISVPFVDGTTSYSGEVDLAGEYDELIEYTHLDSNSQVYRWDCGGYGYLGTPVFTTHLNKNGQWGYIHVIEKIKLIYSFNYVASTKRLSGSVRCEIYLEMYTTPGLQPCGIVEKSTFTEHYQAQSPVIGGTGVRCQFQPGDGQAEVTYVCDDSLTVPALDYEVGDLSCCQVQFPFIQDPEITNIFHELHVGDPPTLGGGEVIAEHFNIYGRYRCESGGAGINPFQIAARTLAFPNKSACKALGSIDLEGSGWEGFTNVIKCTEFSGHGVIPTHDDEIVVGTYTLPSVDRSGKSLSAQVYYAE